MSLTLCIITQLASCNTLQNECMQTRTMPLGQNQNRHTATILNFLRSPFISVALKHHNCFKNPLISSTLTTWWKTLYVYVYVCMFSLIWHYPDFNNNKKPLHFSARELLSLPQGGLGPFLASEYSVGARCSLWVGSGAATDGHTGTGIWAWTDRGSNSWPGIGPKVAATLAGAGLEIFVADQMLCSSALLAHCPALPTLLIFFIRDQGNTVKGGRRWWVVTRFKYGLAHGAWPSVSEGPCRPTGGFDRFLVLHCLSPSSLFF